MAEIIKVYKQSAGAMRFIGKRYTDADRVNGMFGAKWDEWMKNGWLDTIRAGAGSVEGICADGDAPVGLMRVTEGEFEYWIGLFAPQDAAVPDGFQYVDFPVGNIGVCWVYGKEPDIYMREGECWERLAKEGYEGANMWFFERYAARFNAPDDKGNIILDICFFVK